MLFRKTEHVRNLNEFEIIFSPYGEFLKKCNFYRDRKFWLQTKTPVLKYFFICDIIFRIFFYNILTLVTSIAEKTTGMPTYIKEHENRILVPFERRRKRTTYMEIL